MVRFALIRACVALALAAVAGSAWGADNWPAWRGPLGTGVAEAQGLPLEWTNTRGIAWKAPLPGPGNSTPIVWGERVFVTCAREGGKFRALLCFDRRTGEELWRREVAYDAPEKTHDTNPHCSASPVTDGERVVVWHGSAGMFCYNFAGDEQWRKDLGAFDHIWGSAASPVLYENLVILSAGPGMSAFVAAFDKTSGAEKWRVTPPDAVSEKVDEFRGSWSTPVLHTVNGKTQLLLSLPLALVGYDPATGEELWRCRGLSKLCYTSPLVQGDVAVAMSGYHGPALAVRLGGTGDVTDTHRLWLDDQRIPQRVGSGVIVGDHVYILNEPGIAWCIDLRTGQRKWEQRVPGGKSWCSMVHADGRLYVTTDGGAVVLAVDPTECKVLATNPMGEMTRASPAIAGKHIFIRTYRHLYCVGEKE